MTGATPSMAAGGHDGLGGASPFERAASWQGEVRWIHDERALDALLAAPAGDKGRTITKKGIRLQPGQAARLRAGGDRADRHARRLPAGLRGDAGEHRRPDHAGGVPGEDRAAIRPLRPDLDHGSRHSHRGDAGLDARGRCAGALSGGHAQGPAERGLRRRFWAGPGREVRSPWTSSCAGRRRRAVRPRALGGAALEGTRHAPAAGRAATAVQQPGPVDAQARRRQEGGGPGLEPGRPPRARDRRGTRRQRLLIPPAARPATPGPPPRGPLPVALQHVAEDPATLWRLYMQLIEIEQAFKELKHDCC